MNDHPKAIRVRGENLWFRIVCQLLGIAVRWCSAPQSTIFSCFQGDVLCDIDNCINPWFTQSVGNCSFPSVGFLIARWSVISERLDLSPLCLHVRGKSGTKLSLFFFYYGNDSQMWALHLLALSFLQAFCLYFCEVCLRVEACLCKYISEMAWWHPVFSVSEAKNIHVNSACAKSTVKIFMDENATQLSVCNFHCITEQSSCLRVWWFIHSA